MQGVLTRIQSLSIRRPRRSGVGWTIAAAVIALFVLMPVLALAFQALQGSPGLWTHLIATVLPPALGDTLVLLAGVAIVTGCLGTALAWLVTAYAFRGRWLLDWMLLLPLAVPTYIIAYAYLDILHPIGPVQGVIRWLLGYESPRDFRLPDIRSMTGCILLLGFVLYPYVYIPTRAMFLTQSASLVEVSRTLGISRRGVFRRVALPLARPAVAIGISLALMEALNDIGAAEFLGVRTLTVSIYTTWITRSDLPGAAQIALFLLFLVVMLVAVERFARRSQGYSAGAQRARPFVPHAVGGAKGVLLFALGLLPVLIGFAAPAAYLVSSAWQRYQFAGLSPRLIGEAVNTVAIAATATAATVVLGLVIAYACRLRPGLATGWLYRLSTVGYAAPGTVVAIGVLIVVAGIDGFLDRAVMHWFGVSTGLFFMGSGAALLYAYSMRFLTISAGTTEAGLSRIPRSFDHASRTLGMTSGATLRLVHLPLSRAAIAAGALLVFVDCVKELPATLLLRPLNFETFATHLYGEAARGTYEEASLAALAIVVIGILPVILLARVGKQNVAD